MNAILTFHSIDDGGSVLSFPREGLRRLVEALRADGTTFVTVPELLRPGSAAGDGHRVALTFDDGLLSAVETAAPVLAGSGARATIYVVSDWVGRTNRWPSQPAGVPDWPLADWAALRDWVAQGGEVGAHGANHVALRDLDEPTWAAELAGSRARIEDQLQRPVADFAYPYGALGAGTRERVGEVFATAVTTRMAFLAGGEDPLLLPRIDAFYLRGAPGSSPFAPAARARLAARAWLRGLRQAVTGGPR